MPVTTRLQYYAEKYCMFQKINKEMITSYKQQGISIQDPRFMKERGYILYEIWKAKETYVKAYHGSILYKQLYHNYKTALQKYSRLHEDSDDTILLRASNEEKRTRVRLYHCVYQLYQDKPLLI